MSRFAFVIHPIDAKRDVARRFKLLGHLLPVSLIHFFSRFFPPIYVSHIRSIRSATGAEAEGWLLACPYTPRRMLSLDLEEVYAKIADTVRMGERAGAQIAGLGAFTSVVGDAGVSVAQRVNIPVTTGNSYTVATVVRTLGMAAERVGRGLDGAKVAIVGATGSIGQACSLYAAKQGARIIAVGRDIGHLTSLSELMACAGLDRPKISTDMADISTARYIISVAGSAEPVIYPEHLAPGTIVCDVALPPNVAPSVRETRDDVLVLSGGLVAPPGKPEMGFSFGLGAGLVYACMAETMILALEGRFEPFTLGRSVKLDRVAEIDLLGAKHGFVPAGFYGDGTAIGKERLERVRQIARQRAD
jgi:fatty aldehyde-generating acyl-ACP reductase